MMAADVEEDIARAALEESNYDVKLAIFILKTGLGKDDAKKVLDQHKGYIQKAIDYVETNG
jgi:N-acetylmuramic acid 6-phosphate etherase